MDIPRLIHILERSTLVVVALLTIAAVVLEIQAIFQRREVTLADLLLLFLYTEILSMVGVFYASRRIQVIFPIFIGMTALSRLIVLQGKDMAPENILYEAIAILVLSLAAYVVYRLDLRLRRADAMQARSTRKKEGEDT